MIYLINQVALTERYSALQRPMNIRKQRLLDSLQVQQLFRDVEDEEAWIREKEPVAASTNRGKLNLFCSIHTLSRLIFSNFHLSNIT
jgi:hypothetical protein